MSGNKGYLLDQFEEQGISLLLITGTLAKYFREKMKFINWKQREKVRILKGSRELCGDALESDNDVLSSG